MGLRDILRKGPTVGESVRFLFRERTVLGLCLTVIGIAVVVGVRWESLAQQTSEIYVNALKLGWHHEADMVILGDSRIVSGVFPAAMRQVLPDRRILNYGFGGVGYTTGGYMRGAEEVLDPESERKSIVLGITPVSLTEGAARENHFLAIHRKPVREIRHLLGMGRYMSHFRRITEWDLRLYLEGRPDFETVIEGRPDGSIARRTIPEMPNGAIPMYIHTFEKNDRGPVSPRVVDSLLEQVSEWVKKGIAVYAFRPPTSIEMRDLEDELSGFREEEFVARITACGAVWLEPKGGRYGTYDGSHLNPKSAERFSRDLAFGILHSEQERGKVPEETIPPVVSIEGE